MNSIKFGSPSLEGRYSYQDILYEGRIIGCLVTKNAGVISPIEERIYLWGADVLGILTYGLKQESV